MHLTMIIQRILIHYVRHISTYISEPVTFNDYDTPEGIPTYFETYCVQL